MTPSNMAHQRAQDDAAEIEFRAEELEQEAREKLMDFRPVLYLKRNEFGQVITDVKQPFDMWEALHDLREMQITQAFARVGTDLEHLAIAQIKEARNAAVEAVLGQIDFNVWAAAERERAQREDAA